MTGGRLRFEGERRRRRGAREDVHAEAETAEDEICPVAAFGVSLQFWIEDGIARWCKSGEGDLRVIDCYQQSRSRSRDYEVEEPLRSQIHMCYWKARTPRRGRCRREPRNQTARSSIIGQSN
jgi:hypothetical protein